jgi:hypothetical protein
MLEYERQAEERAREQEAMADERDRMLETELRIRKEQERIAQEEYEMRQYYEAEALKHAQEIKLHQEEVRRHQERVRDHERRIMDHEASSEAFAKVIAMPATKGATRAVSFLQAQGGRNGNGAKANGVNGAWGKWIDDENTSWKGKRLFLVLVLLRTLVERSHKDRKKKGWRDSRIPHIDTQDSKSDGKAREIPSVRRFIRRLQIQSSTVARFHRMTYREMR